MIVLARFLRRAWRRIDPADRERVTDATLIAGLVLSVSALAWLVAR